MKNFISVPSVKKAQSDITRTVTYADERMLSTTFFGGYDEGDSISLIEYEGMRKLCEYLGVRPYSPEEVTSFDLDYAGLSDTPSNRLWISMEFLFWRANNEIEITDEQAAYVNTHTDEFNGLCLEKNFDWIIQRTQQTTAMEINSGNVSQEKFFQSFVDEFASRLHDDTEIATYKNANTPTYNVKLDGENVVFTDNTVKAIKEWLDRFSSYNPAIAGFDLNDYNYMQIFGLEFGDDEETIKSKLKAFCEKHGSAESMTVSLKDYYDTIAASNCTGSFDSRVYNSSSKYYKEYLEQYESIDIGNGYKLFILPVEYSYTPLSGQSFTVEGKATSDWPTYEQCGTIIKDSQAMLNALCKDNGLSTTPVSTTPRTAEEGVAGVGNDGGKVSGVSGTTSKPKNTSEAGSSNQGQTTMPIGGVIVDDRNDIAIEVKINAYLEALKEKYPEVYNKYEYTIRNSDTGSFGELYYKNGQVRGYGYIYNIEAEDLYYSPQFMDVLKCAAGITGDEQLSEQASKMEALFKKMGAQGDYLEVDITDMINYLLGDNNEGINYFDKLKSERNAIANQVSNTDLETGTPDSSIKVEVYEPSKIQQNPLEPDGVLKDIIDFTKNLLDPIYAEYFATMGNEAYKNFVLGESDWSNPDSGDYAHITWTWIDDAIKEAFTKEVEAVMAQILEKYSDVITGIMFDGQRICFTTIYDDETPDNSYVPLNEGNLDNFTSALNGMAHSVFGEIKIPGGDDSVKISPSSFKASIDNPVSYSSAPDVISNNIPENAPVGINGETLIKTAWDGIWISENNDYIYLWDSKEQKYLAIKNYTSGANGGTFAQSLVCGYTEGLPFGDRELGGYVIDNILLSLVYGYNRTDVPNVFEKDGKYYTYDIGTKRHRSGLEGLEKMLVEVHYENDAPVTVKVPVKQQTEEVTIKSEDCLAEMEVAASKINLSASKSQGVYYKFTSTGSYLYIWNPVEKKFKAFSINSRNADGTINQEFTQTGRAVKRTKQNIYYEAILIAYKNGYNFTVNFPWICEKDGVYYEYDKESGEFKKKES